MYFLKYQLYYIEQVVILGVNDSVINANFLTFSLNLLLNSFSQLGIVAVDTF